MPNSASVITQEELLSRVEAYLALSDIGPTAFGVAAANRRNLVRDLRRGLDPQLSTVNMIVDFMDNNPPANR